MPTSTGNLSNSNTRLAEEIISQLPNLQRSTLESLAEATLLSSNKAVTAAEKILRESKAVLLHCLRCHEDFDPSTSGTFDCAMEEHDENNGMIESGNSGRCWLYPCCLKNERSKEYCWMGSHVTEWSQFSLKEKDHCCDEADNENYWKDRDMALHYRKTKPRSGLDESHDYIACFECEEGNGCCTTCCTCGKVDDL